MLILHYREGWSKRRIGRALGVDEATIRRRLNATIATLSEHMPHEVRRTLPIIEALLRYEDGATRRHSSKDMAQKREQLADELEASVLRRSADLEQAAECMDADCPAFHKRSKGPDWQQWEMRYLNERGRTSIPTGAYRADRAGKYSDREA
jgi:C4-dicarboxylate-specific signal transduction histidine kinase